VAPDVAADGAEHQREQAAAAFEEPCPFGEWPAVPTTVLAGATTESFHLPSRTGSRVSASVGKRPVPGVQLAALSQADAVTVL
jgi:hypothetical protein